MFEDVYSVFFDDFSSSSGRKRSKNQQNVGWKKQHREPQVRLKHVVIVSASLRANCQIFVGCGSLKVRIRISGSEQKEHFSLL